MIKKMKCTSPSGMHNEFRLCMRLSNPVFYLRLNTLRFTEFSFVTQEIKECEPR